MAAPRAVQFVLSAVNKTTRPVRQATASLRGIQKQAKETACALGMGIVAKKLEGLRKGFAGVGGTMKQLGAATRSLVAPIGALVGLGGVGSLAGVAALINGTAQASAQLYQASQRLGVSVEALQEWQHAASQTGVEADGLNDAFKNLNERLVDAANDQKSEVAQAFRGLGVDIRDAVTGELRDIDAIMSDVAQGLSQVEDPALRSKAAMVLMSDAGERLIPLFAQGADGIRAYREEKQRLGVVDGEAAQQANDYNQTVGRLKGTLSALIQQIGGRLYPIIGPLIERLTAFIQAHKAEIIDAVSKAIAGMAQALERVDWANTIECVGSTIERIAGLIENVGGLKTVFGVFGAFLMSGPLVAIGTIGKAIFSLSSMAIPALIKAVVAFGSALMATPVGWIVAGIAAIVAAIAGLVYGFKWCYENLDWFRSAVDFVVSAVSGYFKSLWGAAKAVFKFVAEAITGAIERITGFVPDWLLRKLGLSSGGGGGESAETSDPSSGADDPDLEAFRAGPDPGPMPPPPDMMAMPPQVAAAQSVNAGFGDPSRKEKVDVNVRFDNTPPGARVEARGSAGVRAGTDVHYGRSLAGSL